MKKKIFLIISIILSIVLVIFFRKFYLISKITNKIQENSKITNYSFIRTSKNGKSLKVLTKDGMAIVENTTKYENDKVKKEVFFIEKNQSTNLEYELHNIHTLNEENKINSTEIVVFTFDKEPLSDFARNEIREKSPDTLAIGTVNSNLDDDYRNYEHLLTCGIDEEMHFIDKVKAVFSWNISIETVNNIKCYHIDKKEGNKNEYWLNVENCNKVKANILNGLEVCYYDIKINSVTDKDMFTNN